MMNSAGAQKDPFDWLVDRLDEADWPWISVMQDDEAGIDAFTGEKSNDKKRNVGFGGMGGDHGGDYGGGPDDDLADFDWLDEYASGTDVSGTERSGGGSSGADTVIANKVTTAAQRKQRGRMDYSHTLGALVETSHHLSQLKQLGLCGLFHDLGKTRISGDISRKPGKLTAEEMRKIQAHSIESVRLLIKLRASWKRKSRIILAPFEHHLKYNLKGYPYVGWDKPISLFGRILAITDSYDALTSARAYRLEALTPDRALAIMVRASNVDYDPILLKVFINMLGVYPLGTVVLFADGEIGIVCEIVKGGPADLPKVLLLKADENGGFSEGEVIDLGEKDPGTDEYRRKILRTIHPAECNIQPAEYLLRSA